MLSGTGGSEGVATPVLRKGKKHNMKTKYVTAVQEVTTRFDQGADAVGRLAILFCVKVSIV